MNRQLDNLGSQRKVSVSVPKLREKEPDLTLKAPTYIFRDSRYLSTRQGGVHYSAVAGLFLFFFGLDSEDFSGKDNNTHTIQFLWPRKCHRLLHPFKNPILWGGSKRGLSYRLKNSAQIYPSTRIISICHRPLENKEGQG